MWWQRIPWQELDPAKVENKRHPTRTPSEGIRTERAPTHFLGILFLEKNHLRSATVPSTFIYYKRYVASYVLVIFGGDIRGAILEERLLISVTGEAQAVPIYNEKLTFLPLYSPNSLDWTAQYPNETVTVFIG